MANKMYLFYISKNYKDQSCIKREVVKTMMTIYVFGKSLFGIFDIKTNYFDM